MEIPSALLSLALFPFCLPFGGTHDEGQPLARFQPMDVFELEYASDPRVWGDRVVYVRNGFDVMTDRRRTGLWIVGTDGEHHEPLTSGPDASSPRWSPGGGRIAYLAGSEEKTQIWVLWMESGRTAPITRLVETPSNLTWSPDGKWIAFTMHVPAEPEPMVKMPKAPEGAEWAPRAKVIERTLYRADGRGYLEEGFTHLFVVPAEGGSPRQLTDGPFHHRGRPAWSTGGDALMISANRRDDAELAQRDTEIWEVSFPAGELTQLTDRRGPDGSPVVSPDGESIAYLSYEDRYQGHQTTRVWVMDRDGSHKRSLTGNLDRSARSPAWSGDGMGVFFLYDDRGDTKIGYETAGMSGFKVQHDWVGGTSLGRPYASGSFSVRLWECAFTRGRPDRPAEVAFGDIHGSQVLTALNEDLLGARSLGAVEEIWFQSSHDDRDIQAWIVTPPDYDPERKYPLILEIHGGPFANYGPRFAAEIQLYASAGYVVLYVNPRGSTSYGEEFGNLIHHAYPGHDYDDLMSAVDAVIEQGHVDPERLFVTGGSGGGVLSSWIVGKTDRFRAAVVAKPVINWYSFVLTADAYPTFYKYWFPGLPWDHLEHYMARSPISLVGNVTTPTMLLTGEEDYRTPISESEQYYQALQLQGVESALVRIPGAGHGIAARPSHLIAKVLHVLAWFERHGGEPVDFDDSGEY